MTPSIHIVGGRLMDPLTGRDEEGDLFIEDGVIVSGLSSSRSARKIEARGLVVAPGLIDLHVHFRDPGNTDAETLESGSLAAARGGFTTVVTMPNTNPPIDTPEAVADQLRRSARTEHVRVLPSACITRRRAGKQLADLAAMAKAGAVAFTDDGSTVPDAGLMEEAMKTAARIGIPLFDHAQDPSLAGTGVMRQGEHSRRMGLPGMPIEAETWIVERDCNLAAKINCSVHIQHVSCRESVQFLRKAQNQRLPVSGEVTPHHIALSDSDIVSDNANFKMNPPLGSRDDREALMDAVADGTIRAFATDHAPHRPAEKARGFANAPFGVVGLETAVGITYTLLVRSGRMPPMDWLSRWTSGPASTLGMPTPSLQPGQPGNVVVLNLDSEWTVRSDDFLSKSRNTPFEGTTLFGRPVYTLYRGRITWNRR